ncbi:MAG: glycosyltransferase [Gemmatimonadaceae bacterium]
MRRTFLFLARSLGVGGAERQLVVLAKGLQARGHRVVVACFYGGGTLEGDLAGSGVTVVDLKKGGRWNAFGFYRRLISLVRREKPAVIHGYLPVPNIVSVLVRPLARGATIAWGVRASDMDLSQYEAIDRVAFRAATALSRFADVIVANSWSGADYHVHEGYPRDRMHVIPNGIDTDRFRPEPSARATIRREWDIAPDDELVGLVARLDPMKGHPVFLRALAILREDHPRIRAVCVGDGTASYRGELHTLSAALGVSDILRWAGSRQDTRAIYNALDLLCSSSVFGEGFSNSVGEAMACGTPCVVTDVGDSARLVGSLGRVVPPNDPVALAAAMSDGLRMRSAAHSLECRRLVEAEYGVERLIERSEALLASAP